MSTISDQIKKLQDEANEQAAKIQDAVNLRIAKLTAGAEKELLATLTTASEAFKALPDARKLELWKEEAFDGILTDLKLQPIKTKGKGRSKGSSGAGGERKVARWFIKGLLEKSANGLTESAIQKELKGTFPETKITEALKKQTGKLWTNKDGTFTIKK